MLTIPVRVECYHRLLHIASVPADPRSRLDGPADGLHLSANFREDLRKPDLRSQANAN
jgi:hypothetical protein